MVGVYVGGSCCSACRDAVMYRSAHDSATSVVECTRDLAIRYWICGWSVDGGSVVVFCVWFVFGVDLLRVI